MAISCAWTVDEVIAKSALTTYTVTGEDSASRPRKTSRAKPPRYAAREVRGRSGTRRTVSRPLTQRGALEATLATRWRSHYAGARARLHVRILSRRASSWSPLSDLMQRTGSGRDN